MSSGRQFPEYCDVCYKSFSGQIPAEQHYASEDHIKRARIGAGVNRSQFDCDICNATCNSRQQRLEHDASPRHMERQQRQQRSRYSPESRVPQSAFGQNRSNPSRVYDFDGVRGFCHVCNIELTSPQHCRQHVSGTKHQKKESQSKIEIAGGDFGGDLFCPLCKVPFSGPGNAREHYISAKHKKKEMEAQTACMQYNGNSLYQGSPITQPIVAGVQPIFPGISLINASPVPTNLPDPLIPLQNNINRFTHSSSNQNRRAVDFDGQTGYCNACQVELTSPQLMDQHIKGSRHEKSLKQWSVSDSSSGGGDYKCDDCGVTFSGPAPAEQHFASDKHKKRSALPHTNFSTPGNEPVKAGTKLQLNQTELFPTELFPEEDAVISQDPSGTCMPLNIPPENNGQITENLGNALNMTGSCQAQSDSEICLKVDGGSIRPTVPMRTVDRISIANNSNNSSCSETSYAQASSVLSNLISDQNRNIKQDVGTTLPFTFSDNHGWCNICNIELKSVIHAHDHLISEQHRVAAEAQHTVTLSSQSEKLSTASVISGTSSTSENQKNVTQQEYTFDGNRGFCYLCRIELTSPQHAKQHLNGKNHTKAKLNSSSLHEMESNIVSGSSCAADDKPEYEFHGGKGICYVCNIELTSNAHAGQHLEGKNHKKAVERKQQQRNGSNHRLVCEVCHMTFSGPECAEQHFKSTKHLMKLKSSNGGILGSNIGFFNTNAEVPNALYNESLTDVKRVSDFSTNANTELFKPVMPCSQSTMVTNTSCGQTLSKESDIGEQFGICSNDILSALRPAPNNLSCMESMYSNEENPPSMEDAEHSESDSENNHNLGGDSSSRQARRPQPCKTLKNRNQHRQNKMTFHDDDDDDNDDDDDDDDDPVVDCLKGLDRMKISETNPDTISAVKTDNDCCEHDEFISFRSNCSEYLNSDAGSHAAHQNDVSSTPDSTAGGAVANKPKLNPYSKHFRFYCDICDRPMNTQDAYNAHVGGRDHQQKVANIQAPKRTLPPVRRLLTEEEADEKAFNLTEQAPRSYQVELFNKTMQNDSVIFLPTGTGKTHVAAMTVSCMLEINPQRPVLFLVDKVLLVMQQSKYLRKQFGEKTFNRASPDDPSGPLIARKLKIATLCGGIAASDPTPLYQYDVIVAVAAYCSNLMSQSRIYWCDFSLVVFDEAHHCTKKHPFNLLLRDYHMLVDPDRRPKVLGLTASPAGKETEHATYLMLTELLVNVGNAKVQIVEAESTQQQLRKYQSSAKLHIKYEPRTHEEETFRKQLLEYLVSCYLKLNSISNIDQECSLMQFFKPKLARGTPDEQLLRCAEDLNDPDRIKMFMHVVGMLKPNRSDVVTKANVDFLSNHTLIMLMSLQDMDGMGIPCSMEELQPLLNPTISGNFEKAEMLGLNCDRLRYSVRAWQQSAMVSSAFEDDGQKMSLVKQLVSSLHNREYINWQSSPKPIALVLVRERVLAVRLSIFLKGMVKDLGLKVTAIVGHGGGTADSGMRVKEQKRVLDGIKQRKYQIVVATSVAEEGVDIPECELVVCMNLPGTVTGFVQMRGRARKKDSHFVIICSNQKEEEQMHNLLKREKNMMAAAKKCVDEQKREENRFSY
ncbi:uncharacterized protein LOC121380886 [Gigantopelta aegis]|uniref:uncharacterized protein LOC121380886 n=1 Tax=Gigantopelta aegis TaxID=1735272 RepID=UPI001B889AE2|nr:uncharacterized protein LOC121380886 [Gigantopelta aegis]XP_041365828.1 uncharacterized protein LOC121380886 [Gigantopelta aegis]